MSVADQFFDIGYFRKANPFIADNSNLWEPQIVAYYDIYTHFRSSKAEQHAVVILPTGTGKTGVIALSPFGISEGRVLVITPQLVIKDHVLDSLDPTNPTNFWLNQKVFSGYDKLPVVVEYEKDTRQTDLESANIVILNVHKLQTRSRNSLLERVPNDFFNMIIIDEAHHSPAQTWDKALKYFGEAKVVKVTGTPFRSDNQPIEGRIVTDYKLGRAMERGYVKSLRNFIVVPDKLYLTIDGNEDEKYTLEEIRDLGLKEEDWISRSVAYSPECSMQVVEESYRQLQEKKASGVPHKIIAVACTIEHAQQIEGMYTGIGLRSALVHSELSDQIRHDRLRSIEAHEVDVVIHVALLGEGYDHPYLSIAAIFRPFRSLAPYAQFIGRTLRRIPPNQTKMAGDNVAVVVGHKDLNLDPLWDEYQKEQQYMDITEKIREQRKQEGSMAKGIKNYDFGDVEVDGDFQVEYKNYVTTATTKEYDEYEQEMKAKVEQLKQIMSNLDDQQARRMIESQRKPEDFNPIYLRPDKYVKQVKQNFAMQVQETIPADIILEFGLIKEERTLSRLPVLKKYLWLASDEKSDNAAIIARYLNQILFERFGKRGEWEWTIQEVEYAQEYLDQVVDHLKVVIRDTL
jgi:superfamily II DNA or RNA helicase